MNKGYKRVVPGNSDRDRPTKLRIKEAIDKLKKDPPEGNIKPMEGDFWKGYFRVRVGQYRIIYRYDMDNCLKILIIFRIGPRGDIYK